MMRFVELRVGDRRVLRVIRGWLKAGVVEDGKRQPATKGTRPAFAGPGSRGGHLAVAGEYLPILCL
jgi:hypothetical protein